MAFVDKEIKFVLTTYGKKTLVEKGWTKMKINYTLFDDSVIYTVNAYPNLIPDVNGIGNNISETMNFNYNLK